MYKLEFIFPSAIVQTTAIVNAYDLHINYEEEKKTLQITHARHTHTPMCSNRIASNRMYDFIQANDKMTIEKCLS